MTPEIFIAKTDAEIESCFPVFSALRPHIERTNFLAQVRRQQTQSYQILALRHEGAVRSAAGFRFAEFLAWGKVLYIDDLTTLPGETSKGFAGNWKRICTVGCRKWERHRSMLVVQLMQRIFNLAGVARQVVMSVRCCHRAR